MKLNDLYKRYMDGEKFKRLSEMDIGNLPIKHPSDLVGRSPIMQKLAKKHSKYLKKE
jgi:hypothetical protein